MLAYEIIAVLIAGAGVLTAGFIYLRRAAENSVALDARDAALTVERDRVAAMEAAAAEDRRKRKLGFDVDAAKIHDATGAADLLREAAAGRTKPN